MFHELHIATEGEYVFPTKKTIITLRKGKMLLFEPKYYHMAVLPHEGYKSEVLAFSIEEAKSEIVISYASIKTHSFFPIAAAERTMVCVLPEQQ